MLSITEPLNEPDVLVILPVTPNEPVIWAEPVNGNPGVAFNANDAVCANEALVAKDELIEVDANDADVEFIAKDALVAVEANDELIALSAFKACDAEVAVLALPSKLPVNEVAFIEPVTTNGVEILTVIPSSEIFESFK